MFKALKRTKSKGAAQQVLLAVCWHADADGLCYPSLRALAKLAKVSRQTVVSCLRELVATGELAVLTRGHVDRDRVKDRGRRGGFQPTNYYQVKVVNLVDHLGGQNGTGQVVQMAGGLTSVLNKSVNKSGASGLFGTLPATSQIVHLLKLHVHELLDANPLDGGVPMLDALERWGAVRNLPMTAELLQQAIELAIEERRAKALAPPAKKAQSA